MVSGVWAVVAESERVQWTLDPLKAVGPLRFGMTHDDVVAALDGLMRASSWGGAYGGPIQRAYFSFAGVVSGPVVTCFYDEDDATLGCVAVSALHGPQVTLDNLRLVGRVPSELETEFDEYTAAHGLGLYYSQHADPASQDLGLVLRAQRAGDIMLSRPVFVAAAWAERCYDYSEGRIPMEEWRDRVW
jgi:hypothetical protein